MHGGDDRFDFILGNSVPFRDPQLYIPVFLPVVVHGKLHILKAVICPHRGKVHFPLGAGLITVPGEDGRQGIVIPHWPYIVIVACKSGAVAVLSRHNGGAGGHADGTVAVAAGKGDPLVHQPVEVRRKYMSVPQCVDGIKTLLVVVIKRTFGLFKFMVLPERIIYFS